MSEHTIKLHKRVRGVRRMPNLDDPHEVSKVQTARRRVLGQKTWFDQRHIDALEQEWQERCEAAYRHGYGDGKKIGFQYCNNRGLPE